MIRLIQNWNNNGIAALVGEDVVKRFSDDIDTMAQFVYENQEFGFWISNVPTTIYDDEIYSKEEIIKAFNILIYGCDSDKETYESIKDYTFTFISNM
ncbi:MAG: hypothetical protein K6G87_18455 [Butyrivibrio sp.]|uniref:hypothetical protein n=1 Tax=Butyrivibrio sp. TaxID=28121 RepID=UPI0025EF277D|nr:hypothetical protein [Butyrivibrio sp.]MCR5773208.1 hypothetical protein [Butyrivibrio sp.]